MAAMAWLALTFAGLLEVVWAFSMKQSEGFTRLWPSVITAATMLLSFGLLALSMRSLPLGTAYTVWTGIGAAGTAIYGMIFLDDVVSVLKLVSISLVIVGVIGLQLSGSAH